MPATVRCWSSSTAFTAARRAGPPARAAPPGHGRVEQVVRPRRSPAGEHPQLPERPGIPEPHLHPPFEVEGGVDVAVGVGRAGLGDEQLAAHAQVDAERVVGAVEVDDDPLPVAAHPHDPAAGESRHGSGVGVADGARVRDRERPEGPSGSDPVQLGRGDTDLGRLGHQPSSSSSGSISSPAAAERRWPGRRPGRTRRRSRPRRPAPGRAAAGDRASGPRRRGPW